MANLEESWRNNHTLAQGSHKEKAQYTLALLKVGVPVQVIREMLTKDWFFQLNGSQGLEFKKLVTAENQRQIAALEVSNRDQPASEALVDQIQHNIKALLDDDFEAWLAPMSEVIEEAPRCPHSKPHSLKDEGFSLTGPFNKALAFIL